MSETHYLATHPVARALEIFGDRWTILILREMFLGYHRFGELQQRTGASKGSLSSRLESLVAEEILYQKLYVEKPRRYEYHLTSKGLAAYSWALMLWQWEQTWTDDSRSALPAILRHLQSTAASTKYAARGSANTTSIGPDIDSAGDSTGDLTSDLTNNPKVASANSAPSAKSATEGCEHPLTPLAVCRHCRQPLSYDDIMRVPLHTDVVVSGKPAFLGNQRRARARELEQQALGHISEIIGDRWTLLIMGCAFIGITRFDSVMQQLGIASNILSSRLKLLVSHGLLTKVPLSQERHHEYRLTDKGKSLYPQTMVLRQWALEWLTPVKHPVTLVHAPCGNVLETDVICTGCGTIPDAHDVLFH